MNGLEYHMVPEQEPGLELLQGLEQEQRSVSQRLTDFDHMTSYSKTHKHTPHKDPCEIWLQVLLSLMNIKVDTHSISNFVQVGVIIRFNWLSLVQFIKRPELIRCRVPSALHKGAQSIHCTGIWPQLAA